MRTILTFLTAFLLAFTARSQTSIVVRTAATMHNPTNYTLVTPTSVQFFTSNGITSFSLTLTSNANATDWRADLGISDWVTNPAAPSYSLTEIGVTPYSTNLLAKGTNQESWMDALAIPNWPISVPSWTTNVLVDSGDANAFRTNLGISEWTTNADSPLFNATAYSSNLTLLSDAESWQGALSIEPNASAVVDTVADLAATEAATGKAVFVRGYYAAGDGGGGWFYASNTDTNVDGIGLCFESATANWAWNRIRSDTNFVNIKWFGAMGDGVTVNNLAISNAVNAAEHVYIPSGEYRVDAKYNGGPYGVYETAPNCVIKLRSNHKIYGDGMSASKIRMHGIDPTWTDGVTNTAIMMFWTKSTDLHLTNVVIRDIGLSHTNYTGAVFANNHNRLIFVLSESGGRTGDFRIERVAFEQSFGLAVQCWYYGTTVTPVTMRYDSAITDCVFAKISNTAINLPFGPIERCYFSNVGQIIEGETRVFRGNYAIYCSQLNFNQGAFADTAEYSGYYSIEDNVFMHCVPGGSIFAQIPSRSAVVRNNYFFDIDGAAIAIVPFTGYKPNEPTPIGESRRAVVQNNSFINCGSYYTSGGCKNSLLIHAGNNVIKDNYFGNTLHHTTYGWGSHGIQLSLSGTNNIFSGNVFKDVGKYYANNGCTNNVIVPDVLNRANWRYNETIVGVSNIYSGDLYTGPYEDSPFITAHPFSAPSNYVNGVASKLNAYPGSMYLSMGGGTNKTLWLNQSIAKGSTSSNNWNAVLTDAPRWIDSMVPAASMRLPSSGYPGLDTFTNGIQCLKFDDASDESVHFAVQINHNAVMPTNTLKPHVHWTTSEVQTAPNTNIVWGLEYTIANISAEFVASSTIYLTNGPVELNKLAHTMTSFADIPVTAMTPSMVIMCRLFRDADNGADTLTGDANLIGFDFHYQVDSLGSETP